jgi:hypothetical protein
MNQRHAIEFLQMHVARASQTVIDRLNPVAVEPPNKAPSPPTEIIDAGDAVAVCPSPAVPKVR